VTRASSNATYGRRRAGERVTDGKSGLIADLDEGHYFKDA
jgi:hypothetical protein